MNKETYVGKKVKDYNMLQVIGSGNFGKVYLATNDQGQKFAIKLIDKSKLDNSKILTQLLKSEIKILRKIKNQNVIHFFQSFQNKSYIFIVTEYCNGGTLEQYIKQNKRIPQQQAIMYLKEIINGFKGIHEVNAIHRDLKIANILLNDSVCKIADLGFAKILQSQNSITHTVLGTPLFMAPQVLQKKSYGRQTDIWGLGVVFYLLLYGVYPYYGKNQYELLKNITKLRPSFDSIKISDKARDFIDRCLVYDRSQRFTWKQIYEHPLIQPKRSSLLFNAHHSKINFQRNKDFYNKALRPLSPSEGKTQLSQCSQNEKQVQNKTQLLKRFQLSQKLQAELLRLQKIYFNRRNSIMFSMVYIKPFVSQLYYLVAKHSELMFFILKATYLQIDAFKQSVQKKKNIFKVQGFLEQFVNSNNYTCIIKQLQQDLQSIQQNWKYFYNDLQGRSTTIQKQQKINETNDPNFKANLKEKIEEYLSDLSKYLFKLEGTKKICLIKLMTSLVYYNKAEHPNSQQFDKLLGILNYEKVQGDLVKYQKN